jgi:amidophosphoribosyltransferase
MLNKLDAKNIIIVSSAPQIRYPDCYGIDMSELGKFIAFQATVALHRRAGRQSLLDRIYDDCRAELKLPADQRKNRVQAVYAAFSEEEIAAEISRMVYPEGIEWDGEVVVIFQSIENLHASIKGDCGDWYFTGHYPTPGGYSMVNQAYLRWYEGVCGRSYDLPL